MCRPVNPSNLLIRIWNERRSCFVLSKDITILKYLEHQNQTPTEIGLVFIPVHGSCIFCLFANFLVYLSFLPSCICIYGAQNIALNILLYWLTFCGKSHYLDFIVYSFETGGSNKKLKSVITGPNWDAMAGYLLYRFKHLCVFIFLVNSPSLIEAKYIYCI